MARDPGASPPAQAGGWAELSGAYRLLNNPRVSPDDLQHPHRLATRGRCAGHAVVLCVQDTSTLDYTAHGAKKGLGPIGRQNGKGLLQHSALAVTPSGRLLGVLHQRWQPRVAAPAKETSHQRRGRWREGLLWAEAVEAAGPAPAGTRFVHVADRGGDAFDTLHACREGGCGWVIRAQHDRLVGGQRLRELLAGRPVLKTITVKVPKRRPKRAGVRGPGAGGTPARKARLEVRVAEGVVVAAPRGPGHDRPPVTTHVVHAKEVDPPAGVEPLDWVLLTGEPVASARAAAAVIGYYRRRWVVEEYHRVQKSGCRLEASQLRDADALRRLAAVAGVCAVRLLWLRDLAAPALAPRPKAKAAPAAKAPAPAAKAAGPTPAPPAAGDDPARLAALVPPLWVRVVAKLSGTPPERLTPREFWHAVARRGGWQGRKGDKTPGWITLWKGWHQVALLVQGASILAGDGP